MKSLFFIFLLINCIHAIGQTKQETIDWLNNKFNSSPFLERKLSDGRLVETETRHLKINNDGSFEIYCKTWLSKSSVIGNPDYTFTVRGNFKDLSPNSVATRVTGTNLFIDVSCSSGDCLKQRNDDNKVYMVSQTLIGLKDITSDRSLIERCKKAFIHLIKLCGGKNEIF